MNINETIARIDRLNEIGAHMAAEKLMDELEAYLDAQREEALRAPAQAPVLDAKPVRIVCQNTLKWAQ